MAAANAPAATPAPAKLDQRFARLADKRVVPVRRLGRVTDALVEVRLARASELESQDRWAEALLELRAARARIAGAKKLGYESLDHRVEERIASVRASGSAFHVQGARLALEQGLLAEALARLDAADELQPTPESRPVRGETHVAWADRSAAEGDLYATAFHLVSAVAADPRPDWKQRSADLNRRIGLRLLELGACRAAVGHLEAAIGSAGADPALATARRCATTAVELRVSSQVSPPVTRLAERVEQAALATLGERASRFVQLGPQPAQSPASPGLPPPRGPFEVDVTVRTLRHASEVPRRQLHTMPVQMAWTHGFEPAMGHITWEEIVEPATARLSATVTHIPPGRAERSTSHAIGDGRSEAAWLGRTVGYTYSGMYGPSVASTTWGPGGDPRPGQQPLAARKEARRAALDAAIDALGEAVARGILLAVDLEDPIPASVLAIEQPW